MTAPSASVGRGAIAPHERCLQAQRAVDALSDRTFPVERLAIVRQDLWFVGITGCLGHGHGALGHALTGGHHDLFPVSGLQAGCFELRADEGVADADARMLAQVRTETSSPS